MKKIDRILALEAELVALRTEVRSLRATVSMLSANKYAPWVPNQMPQWGPFNPTCTPAVPYKTAPTIS